MRYKVKVAYNGANYFGWQRQKNEISVQSVIEEKLSTIFNEEITIFASGRTDALVHATGQVFHFDANVFPSRKLKYALNRMLPQDIMILSLIKTSDDFHARYNARKKSYEYTIKLAAKDPFNYKTMLLYPEVIDVRRLKRRATAFVGIHNFQNFTSKSSDENGFKREIMSVDIKKTGDVMKIKFVGSGFMRGQIRFMVGALLAINEGREDETFIRNNLNTNERKIIAYKVSGHGLCLTKVWY